MANILLIDDDEQVRRVVRRMLESMGHAVCDASDGAEGIRAFHETPCDVVVTDILMPEQEGLETIAELRRQAPDLKVIAISGGGDRVRAEDCLDLASYHGATYTLQKPFTSKQLASAVEALVA